MCVGVEPATPHLDSPVGLRLFYKIKRHENAVGNVWSEKRVRRFALRMLSEPNFLRDLFAQCSRARSQMWRLQTKESGRRVLGLPRMAQR